MTLFTQFPHRSLFSAVLLCVCSIAAQVQAAPPKSPPYPFIIFGGADAGLAALSTGSTGELSKKGVQFNLKGIGSFYSGNRNVYDLGLGWSYTRVVGETSTKVERNYLRAGILEFGWRYRQDDFWQFGPYLNIGFAADQSFSQGPNDQPGVVAYPGLQVFHEDLYQKHPIRWGGRVGTSLNTPGSRRIWVVELSFQYGFPFKGSSGREDSVSDANAEYSTTMERHRYTETGNPYLEPTPWAEEAMQLEIKERTVVLRMRETPLQKELTHFKTGSAELSPQSKRFLRNLGAYLAANTNLWKTVQIDGHTDIRGKLQMNMRLSRARAASVARAIQEGGASKRAMKTTGFGPKRPLDPRNNAEAWAKNRRVEIKFLGVADPTALAEGIRAIKGQ